MKVRKKKLKEKGKRKPTYLWRITNSEKKLFCHHKYIQFNAVINLTTCSGQLKGMKITFFWDVMPCTVVEFY